MEVVPVFEKVLEDRELIRNSYSESSNSGLLTLLDLIEVGGTDQSSLEKRFSLLQNLNEEQVYYDLMLSREVISVEFEGISTEEVQHFIVYSLDESITSNFVLNTRKSLEHVLQKMNQLSTEVQESFFGRVYRKRFGMLFFHGLTVDRMYFFRQINESLERLVEFPLNFLSTFKIQSLLKELLSIDQRIESIGGPVDQMDNEHHGIMSHIRNTSIEIGNQNSQSRLHQVLGSMKYLHKLLDLFPRRPDDFNDLVKEDLNLINSGDSRPIKFYVLFLVGCVVFFGNTFLSNLNTWMVVSGSDRGMNLVVKSITNPDLKTQISPGDVISRIGDTVNPTLDEFRNMVDQSDKTVQIGLISNGEQKSLSVPLMESNGREIVGVTFHYLTVEKKLSTVVTVLLFLFYGMNIISYKVRVIGVVEPTISFGFMSVFFVYMGSSVYLLIPKVLNLEPLPIFVSVCFVMIGWWIYKNLWIPVGWYKTVFKQSNPPSEIS